MKIIEIFETPIAAWWLIPAFIVGALLGIMFLALCAAGSNRGD